MCSSPESRRSCDLIQFREHLLLQGQILEHGFDDDVRFVEIVRAQLLA